MSIYEEPVSSRSRDQSLPPPPAQSSVSTRGSSAIPEPEVEEDEPEPLNTETVVKGKKPVRNRCRNFQYFRNLKLYVSNVTMYYLYLEVYMVWASTTWRGRPHGP